MEESQRRYACKTTCTKDLNEPDCILIKKSIIQNAIQNLIWKKKQAYYEEKLKENTANPKKLWKILKQLGLP